MKYSQLIKLTSEELKQKLADQSQKLSKLRFNHAISPLEKPMRLFKTRKNIARIKTLQNQRKHTKQQSK